MIKLENHLKDTSADDKLWKCTGPFQASDPQKVSFAVSQPPLYCLYSAAPSSLWCMLDPSHTTQNQSKYHIISSTLLRLVISKQKNNKITILVNKI